MTTTKAVKSNVDDKFGVSTRYLPKELNSALKNHIEAYCARYGHHFDGDKITYFRGKSKNILYLDYYANEKGKAFLLAYNEQDDYRIDLGFEIVIDSILERLIGKAFSDISA